MEITHASTFSDRYLCRICSSGNDGIPFDVDGLSIPFSHWKKESLKAYGNAIVPQVMYEIFAGIDFIEKNEKNEQYDIDNRQSRQMQ